MQAIFPEIPEIRYEGPDTSDPLAFRYFQPDRRVGSKTMAEHLRFAMAFWHSMNGGGTDPFGVATARRPWDGVSDPIERAKIKLRGIFELTTKLQMPFFCFHDRDIAPVGATLRESNANLDVMTKFVLELYQDYPTRLLWGTAQQFLEPK